MANLKSSLRFYWCTGCGKWHDPYDNQNFHYDMYWEQREPDSLNFDGTKEDLKRFQVARLLLQEDANRFEHRVTRELRLREAKREYEAKNKG
jgi:hypothetical protein